MRNFLWQNQPWQAFKNFAIIFSFIVNIILILVLGVVAILLFPFLSNMVTPLVGGLNDSFVEMNDASIVQTIGVDDTLDIAFTLPLEQQTDVVLADDVSLDVPATFVLPGGGGIINGQVSIVLPQNTVLPVNLALEVPVEQTIPVVLDVPVDIKLSETDLGTPFDRLVTNFNPLTNFLKNLPQDNDEFMSRLNESVLGSESVTEDETTETADTTSTEE
ncbi:MAG: hypothetical protein AAGD96_25360 [Chloroflexota bacterium]